MDVSPDGTYVTAFRDVVTSFVNLTAELGREAGDAKKTMVAIEERCLSALSTLFEELTERTVVLDPDYPDLGPESTLAQLLPNDVEVESVFDCACAAMMYKMRAHHKSYVETIEKAFGGKFKMMVYLGHTILGSKNASRDVTELLGFYDPDQMIRKLNIARANRNRSYCIWLQPQDAKMALELMKRENSDRQEPKGGNIEDAGLGTDRLTDDGSGGENEITYSGLLSSRRKSATKSRSQRLSCVPRQAEVVVYGGLPAGGNCQDGGPKRLVDKTDQWAGRNRVASDDCIAGRDLSISPTHPSRHLSEYEVVVYVDETGPWTKRRKTESSQSQYFSASDGLVISSAKEERKSGSSRNLAQKDEYMRGMEVQYHEATGDLEVANEKVIMLEEELAVSKSKAAKLEDKVRDLEEQVRSQDRYLSSLATSPCTCRLVLEVNEDASLSSVVMADGDDSDCSDWKYQ